MIKKENITPKIYRVEKSKQKDFLALMKTKGYTWINGQKINASDECGQYIGVSNLGYIGKLSLQCYLAIKNNVKVINF